MRGLAACADIDYRYRRPTDSSDGLVLEEIQRIIDEATQAHKSCPLGGRTEPDNAQAIAAICLPHDWPVDVETTLTRAPCEQVYQQYLRWRG